MKEEKRCLEELLAIDAHQFDVITELAWIAFKEGNKEKASEMLELAQSIEPDYSKIYFYHARILQQERKLEEAEKLLQKCMEIDGSNASGQVHNQLGVLAL